MSRIYYRRPYRWFNKQNSYENMKTILPHLWYTLFITIVNLRIRNSYHVKSFFFFIVVLATQRLCSTIIQSVSLAFYQSRKKLASFFFFLCRWLFSIWIERAFYTPSTSAKFMLLAILTLDGLFNAEIHLPFGTIQIFTSTCGPESQNFPS